jgi:hypothetical protein
VELLRDANESPVDKRFPDGFARVRKRSDLQKNFIAEANPRSRHDKAPINAFHRDIFPGGSYIDRMSLGLQGADPFQGVYANRSLGSAVPFCIVLSVI